MPDKRRWLPSWQRIELAEKCELEGWSRRQAAAWRRVSAGTVQYWVERRRAASVEQLITGEWAEDRPATPHSQPLLTSVADHDRVCRARERTGWGPRLIAVEVGMAHATVSRCLVRRGCSRRPTPARGEVFRHEWPCPGDLLQMDTKQFPRFSRPGHAVTGDRARTGAEKRERVGVELAHSVIDDHTRVAYTELHPDERATTVTAFLARALAFYRRVGIEPRRVQTDNHYSYVKNRSLRELLAREGISHHTIRPRTPRHNGKIERYQQTLGREWGLGMTYRSSTARDQALPHWLQHYNQTRNHSAIGNRPPISRVQKVSRQDN
jgi:transposase InsO family protein